MDNISPLKTHPFARTFAFASFLFLWVGQKQKSVQANAPTTYTDNNPINISIKPDTTLQRKTKGYAYNMGLNASGADEKFDSSLLSIIFVFVGKFCSGLSPPALSPEPLPATLDDHRLPT
jgi:hypothetical protein